ncbi:hypothetical protein A2U01_0103004, partial [Trifolium medium]|nr:hypothetical protein [Trifolium medium]
MGPKCLRLVEVVNSVGASRRRKKIDREEGSKLESHRQSNDVNSAPHPCPIATNVTLE